MVEDQEGDGRKKKGQEGREESGGGRNEASLVECDGRRDGGRKG